MTDILQAGDVDQSRLTAIEQPLLRISTRLFLESTVWTVTTLAATLDLTENRKPNLTSTQLEVLQANLLVVRDVRKV